MKITKISILAILILSIFLIPSVHAAQLNVNVSGPVTVGANTTKSYTITFAGYGFSKYEYHLFLTGTNLTGAYPLSEVVGSSNTITVFTVNITFPQIPQIVYIEVMGIGIRDNVTYTNSAYLAVKVVKPIVLSVQLRNPSDIRINDVTVDFYLDNKYVGNDVVPVINPNSTANATYDLIVPSISQGPHTLKAVVQSNIVYLQNGKNFYEYSFYYGTPPNYSWIWDTVILVIVAVSVLMFFMVLGYRKRPVTTPKWKK